MRLAAVRVFVDDLAPARAFYGGELALPLRAAGPEGCWVVFDGGGVDLVVERVPADAPPEDLALVGRFSGMSLEVDELDAVCRALAERGVRISSPPETQAWGGRTATVADPAGNLLQLVQYPSARDAG
jgi:catechol 2,3-dioxygenase-like lactoylglutathione lyase family enzyme